MHVSFLWKNWETQGNFIFLGNVYPNSRSLNWSFDCIYFFDFDLIKSGEALKILKLCRMLRIFRVAKIGRHNENLRIMMRTMAHSSGEMAFMGTLIVLSIVIFRYILILFNSEQNSVLCVIWLRPKKGISLIRFQVQFGGVVLPWQPSVMVMLYLLRLLGRYYRKVWK